MILSSLVDSDALNTKITILSCLKIPNEQSFSSCHIYVVLRCLSGGYRHQDEKILIQINGHNLYSPESSSIDWARGEIKAACMLNELKCWSGGVVLIGAIEIEGIGLIA